MSLIDLGSGVKYEATTVGSGTGNYDSFLRLQNTGVETGYNTDVNNQLNNKDGIWTHSLLISSLAVINVGGVDYYEIRLDLDEVQSGDGPPITLTELQIYRGAAAGGGAAPSFSGLTNVFDLSGSLSLVDTNHGSGTDDYRFLVPTSLFPDPSQYLTLYAAFSGADDGFEEFRVKTQAFVPQPDIGINKQTNGTDDACHNILVGKDVTWTYTVTNNGNLPLSNVVVTDNNGTPGNLLDDFNPNPVLSGGFNVGDTNHNNILDLTETWQYSFTGTAQAGAYTNIATVSGNWSFGGNSGSVNANEDDCYTGVTASISILKKTDGTDGQCLNLIAGSTVNWTYDVTNTGTADINGNTITVTDDNGTVGTGDDFNPAPVLSGGFNTGDLNKDGILNPGETWHYSASGTVTVGDYTNTATVDATAHDDFSNTTSVNNSEGDCYNGSTPSIDIVKMTNGTDNQCPVLHIGDSVTWTYAVTNNSAFDISAVTVTDDNGTSANLGDDFSPSAVLSGGFNVGDTNQDGILNPGETWQYTATGVAAAGEYTNVATVNGTATDENNNTAPVSNSESDCYTGVQGCVRTPGFWQNPNNGGQFWDGIIGNENHAGEDGFPLGDLLYPVDSNHDGTAGGAGDVAGLLIGDYDHNGVGTGEDVIFISLSNALALINANNKQMSDGVVKIGRDVVATWLNYLAGSGIGNASDTNSPHHFIDDAINYLQIFGDSSPSNAASSEVFDTYSATHDHPIKTSSPFWNNNFPGGDHSGSDIHAALDGYNNTGTIGGIAYSASCDNPQFLEELNGFSLNGAVILNSVSLV